MFSKRKNLSYAFTLLELLIGIAILVLVVTVVTSGFRSFLAGQEINAAQEEIVSMLREARERTLSALNSDQHGVHFDMTAGKIVLFEGGRYGANSDKDEEYALKPFIVLDAMYVDGEATTTTEILFKRLSGDVTYNCSDAVGKCVITLKSLKRDYTRTVTINDNGGVETN